MRSIRIWWTSVGGAVKGGAQEAGQYKCVDNTSVCHNDPPHLIQSLYKGYNCRTLYTHNTLHTLHVTCPGHVATCPRCCLLLMLPPWHRSSHPQHSTLNSLLPVAGLLYISARLFNWIFISIQIFFLHLIQIFFLHPGVLWCSWWRAADGGSWRQLGSSSCSSPDPIPGPGHVTCGGRLIINYILYLISTLALSELNKYQINFVN